MNVGDLVRGDAGEAGECYGIVLAFQEEEYVIIRWLDTGENTCYDLLDEDLENWIEVISESR